MFVNGFGQAESGCRRAGFFGAKKFALRFAADGTLQFSPRKEEQDGAANRHREREIEHAMRAPICKCARTPVVHHFRKSESRMPEAEKFAQGALVFVLPAARNRDERQKRERDVQKQNRADCPDNGGPDALELRRAERAPAQQNPRHGARDDNRAQK